MDDIQISDYASLNITSKERIEVFVAQNYKTVFPNHWHEHYCISIIEKGIFNENEYFAEQGTVFITNPMEIHKNDLVFENGTSFKTIYISQTLMDYYSGFTFLKIDCRAVKDHYLFKLIADVIESIMKNNGSFDIKNIELLIQYLSKKYVEKEKTTKISRLDSHIILIKDFINQNCDEKLLIEDLAKLVNMKSITFIKYFKKKTGISPFEYIMMKRIQKGMHLINSGQNITESALSSGFYDQSQFIRYFKRYIGVTPSKYKSKKGNIIQF